MGRGRGGGGRVVLEPTIDTTTCILEHERNMCSLHLQTQSRGIYPRLELDLYLPHPLSRRVTDI